MSEKSSGIFTLTTPVVMSFPNLFVPKAFKSGGVEKGEPKYGASFVFKADHPDLESLKNLVIKVAKERWPDRELKTISLPFASGTKQADKRAEACKAKGKATDGEYQRGCAVITAKSKLQPSLAYIANGKIVELTDESSRIANKDKFYFGVHALASFNVVAYQGQTVRVGDQEIRADGVTCYLNSVLSLNKGERLGGGAPSAAETFKGYAGYVSMEDPTAHADAGIPNAW